MNRRPVALISMVEQIGRLKPADLSDWEKDFIPSVVKRSDGGRDTTRLSRAQVESVEKIWVRHFI